MIELMVVVSIIVLLALLVFRIKGSLKDTANIRATATAMACLHNASQAYQQAVPMTLTHADAANYFVDLASNGTKNRAMTPMEYFTFRALENADSKQQMDRVPTHMLVAVQDAPVQIWKGNTPGVLIKVNYTLKTVKDPWGNELKYRALSTAAIGEPDLAMPYSNYTYFASAGPNGLWGELINHDVNQPLDDAQDSAQDNIYSTIQ